jgi:polysaccharide export outer membrane protein
LLVTEFVFLESRAFLKSRDKILGRSKVSRFHNIMKVILYSFFLFGLCLGSSNLFAQADANYRISPSDQLAISVFDEPELSVERSVVGSGMISLELLSEQVKVGGKTAREAEIAIAKAYQENQLLRSPQVTVTVMTFALHSVSVMGFVNKPGKVPMPPGQTRISIIDAIAGAMDFKGIAQKKKVTITRKKGAQKPEIIDYEKLIKSGGAAELFLYPGDSVSVPQRLF